MTCRYSGRGAACPCTSRAGEATAGLPHPGWRRSVGGSWTWRKSSASDGDAGACLEAAWTGESVFVRDSTRREDVVLVLGPEAWSAFLALAAPPPAQDSPLV
ncbi:DUF397 domain-containing protein [Streptomyces sp. NPDC087300]|uniref:DUF397 domain-containing protein n=1 Tax=Streptomyces sp. NPDC087300 TaxID=3365780 RepID=UPI00380C88C7